MTKTFDNAGAQGEMIFERIDCLPPELVNRLVRVKPADGQLIVGHSETGHHHVFDLMDRDDGVVEMYRLPESIYEAFLVVNEPIPLTHLRETDTHEDLLFKPNVYRVHYQEETTPEGMTRRSLD